MATPFRRTPIRRAFDTVMVALARRGIARGGISTLTVVGRTSGEPRVVPITPITVNAQRYLVAPYGPVAWVQNLRSAGGEGTLRFGKRLERISAVEVDAATAAPVLKMYLQQIPIVRSQFSVGPDDPESAFEAIADRHPVFELNAVDAG